VNYRNFNEFEQRSRHCTGQKKYFVTRILEGGGFCRRQVATVRAAYRECTTTTALGLRMAYEFDALRIIPILVKDKIEFICSFGLSPKELVDHIEHFERRWDVTYPGNAVLAMLYS